MNPLRLMHQCKSAHENMCAYSIRGVHSQPNAGIARALLFRELHVVATHSLRLNLHVRRWTALGARRKAARNGEDV